MTVHAGQALTEVATSAPCPGEEALVLTSPGNGAEASLHVALGDPGTLEAGLPLLPRLAELGRVTIFAHGHARSRLQAAPPAGFTDTTTNAAEIPAPDILVLGTSENAQPAADLAISHPNTRAVIISDYPGSERPLMRLLAPAVPLSSLVLCSPNRWAAEESAADNPDIATHATGSPAYDTITPLSPADVEQVRHELGIDRPLATYFSSLEGRAHARNMAAALGRLAQQGFAVAFRAHPRETENFETIFAELGVPLLDTSEHTSEHIRVASAVAIGRGSILLRTIYDGRVGIYALKAGETSATVPHFVRSGASLAARPDRIPLVADSIMQNSALSRQAQQVMQRDYPRPDQQNTARVMDRIKDALAAARH